MARVSPPSYFAPAPALPLYPPTPSMASSAPRPKAGLDNVLQELQRFQQQLEQERGAVTDEQQQKDWELQVSVYAGRSEE